MLSRTIDFLQSEERLEYLIDKVMGQCADCKQDCKKAHPSHTVACDCCKWMEEHKEEVFVTWRELV